MYSCVSVSYSFGMYFLMFTYVTHHRACHGLNISASFLISSKTADAELNRQVFVFHAHVTPDNDGCSKFDRQRTEIKTYSSSPESLKGRNGETVTMSWNFRTWSHFQPSSAFTHIHQIKAVGGTDGTPILTLTPRWKANGNILELIHVSSTDTKKTLKSVLFDKKIAGKWIHVRERLTYGSKGQYSITLTNLLTGAEVMSYSRSSLDLWRNGASFVRPKWGIYRSLTDASRLKDEQVRFDSFCLAKGTANCV
jgi:hypothetical protein